MRFLRERFKEMQPYHSPYITEGIILNANESPYEAPESLKDFMKSKLDTLLVNRYPDTDSLELAAAIAKVYDVKPHNVVCGVGSDELIDCILEGAIEEGDKVLVPEPSFSMYKQFTILKCGSLLPIPLKSDFSYDTKALLDAIRKEQPKVIFLCNPNNPTGCILTREEIKAILELAEGLVVVDEAYEDFCEEEISMIPFINNYTNLVVLRTFSKAYALAGARVGYGIAHKEVIDFINTVRVPYNLSLFSQEVATWAILHHTSFQDNAIRIIKEKKIVEEGLQKLGVKTYDSHANFIWTELKDEIFEALCEAKIYIRRMLVDGKPYYRITIGTPQENQTLLQFLGTVL